MQHGVFIHRTKNKMVFILFDNIQIKEIFPLIFLRSINYEKLL